MRRACLKSVLWVRSGSLFAGVSARASIRCCSRLCVVRPIKVGVRFRGVLVGKLGFWCPNHDFWVFSGGFWCFWVVFGGRKALLGQNYTF